MATVGWLLLQWVGALYVDRVVARGSALYGALGAVFGLLAFLHMAAYLLLVSAELSQVLWEKRHGRSRPTASIERRGRLSTTPYR